MTRARSHIRDAPTSVLLAYRHALIREGIACILSQAGFLVLGQAESAHALHQLVVQHNPDVVLLDWELPDGGEDTVLALSEVSPSAILVILTRPQPPQEFRAAVRTGIRGYLSVNLSSEEFVTSLRMLAKGDLIVSREMAEHLQGELTSDYREEPVDALTTREREVLGLVAHGATNREISENLIVAENTVKVHLRNILGKLNLRNRQQAAAYAVQEGVVDNIALEETRDSDS